MKSKPKVNPRPAKVTGRRDPKTKPKAKPTNFGADGGEWEVLTFDCSDRERSAAAAKKPEPEGEVTEMMHSLHGSADHLVQLVNQLEARLECVLRDAPPQHGSATIGPVTPKVCGAGRVLQAVQDVQHSTIHQLQAILDRLEL